MKKLKILIFLFLSMLSISTFASVEKENVYLTQLIHQLDAMRPIILAAQKEQPKNTRITFHYTAFQDEKGHIHNGLLEDIEMIRKGITEKLTTPSLEPRVITPVNGDYLGTHTHEARKP